MKIIISILFFCALVLTATGQNNYVDSLKKVRVSYEKKLLVSDEMLDKKEQQSIEKLSYFPIDTAWRIEATLIKDKGKKFKMPTSTERKPIYRRYGWVCLEHEGREFRLAVYQNLELSDKKYKNYLFLPFKDANAPDVTYGAGRFIELYKQKRSKTINVDFNTAFNPYCVYSHRFSCPITPRENHLDFNIEAGEKNPVTKRIKE
ncbi:MAG: DUF1684 domain-containing protein [Brumimicrobium sp.]